MAAALQRRASPMFEALRNYIVLRRELPLAKHSTVTSPSFYFLETAAANKSDFRFLRDFNSNVSSHCAEAAAAAAGNESGDGAPADQINVLPVVDYFNRNNNRLSATEKESGDAVDITNVQTNESVGSFRQLNATVISKMKESIKMDSLDMRDNYMAKMAKKSNVPKEGGRYKNAAGNRFYQLYRGYGLDLPAKLAKSLGAAPPPPPQSVSLPWKTPTDAEQIRVIEAASVPFRLPVNRNENAATGNPYGGLLGCFRDAQIVVPPAPELKGSTYSPCAAPQPSRQCPPPSSSPCPPPQAARRPGVMGSGNPYHGIFAGGDDPCAPSDPCPPKPPPKPDCPPACPPPKKATPPCQPSCPPPPKPPCPPQPKPPCPPKSEPPCPPKGIHGQATSMCNPSSPSYGSVSPMFESHVPKRVGKTQEIGRENALNVGKSLRIPSNRPVRSSVSASVFNSMPTTNFHIEADSRNSLPRKDVEVCRKPLRPFNVPASEARLSTLASKYQSTKIHQTTGKALSPPNKKTLSTLLAERFFRFPRAQETPPGSGTKLAIRKFK